jgi:hypothetical protein
VNVGGIIYSPQWGKLQAKCNKNDYFPRTMNFSLWQTYSPLLLPNAISKEDKIRAPLTSRVRSPHSLNSFLSSSLFVVKSYPSDKRREVLNKFECLAS